MTRFEDGPPGRGRGLWPTVAAIAVGATLIAAPPGVEIALRTLVHDAAGPALRRLPAVPFPRSPNQPPEESTVESNPIGELAREVARLRTELATNAIDEPHDRLVRPSWVTAAALGSAERRGAVAELLIDAVGRDAAGADVSGLEGDLPAVDAGADRQVRGGDLVVRDGAAAGRVAAAGRWTATVRPLTHPDFRLAVILPGGGNEATAVLAGVGEEYALLLHVPSAARIAVGSVVTCDPAETGGAAVPAGVVASIADADADGQREIRVKPLATLAEPAGGAVMIVRAGLNRRRIESAEGSP